MCERGAKYIFLKNQEDAAKRKSMLNCCQKINVVWLCCSCQVRLRVMVAM